MLIWNYRSSLNITIGDPNATTLQIYRDINRHNTSGKQMEIESVKQRHYFGKAWSSSQQKLEHDKQDNNDAR